MRHMMLHLGGVDHVDFSHIVELNQSVVGLQNGPSPLFRDLVVSIHFAQRAMSWAVCTAEWRFWQRCQKYRKYCEYACRLHQKTIRFVLIASTEHGSEIDRPSNQNPSCYRKSFGHVPSILSNGVQHVPFILQTCLVSCLGVPFQLDFVAAGSTWSAFTKNGGKHTSQERA